MRRLYRIKSNIGFGILLAIFIASYVNSTMFSHTHIIDGATIIHSHIHGQHHSDSQDGDHSTEQTALIKQLALNNIIASEAISLDNVIVEELYAIVIPTKIDKEHGKLSAFYATRGPPTLSI